jgi:hypothetical protein
LICASVMSTEKSRTSITLASLGPNAAEALDLGRNHGFARRRPRRVRRG